MKILNVLFATFFVIGLYADDSCRELDSQRKCEKSDQNCVWVPIGRESKCVSKEELKKNKAEDKNVNNVKIDDKKPKIKAPD